MSRYFIEMAYRGDHYAGFQVQKNAVTVQGWLDKAMGILLRREIATVGSSRTDAGVHAYQNYVHFDLEESLSHDFLYKMNAILPRDIVLKGIYPVNETAHARFSATERSYEYVIYAVKNPFLQEGGYYFPYPLNIELLQRSADLISAHHDFKAFSKRNTQVKTFLCDIREARWEQQGDTLVFRISANRFLRGMVRGLVATMLRVGRRQWSLSELQEILEGGDCRRADFSAPPQGLFLREVIYPAGLFLS